ncbi:type I polyketide synthase [Micromonospora sp. WMMD736]|uniref:type I polyketide synthase n=1 Tax=Micromonospora sp. WMMD736 TaxID=3404112 RepID=UPI003B92E152
MSNEEKLRAYLRRASADLAETKRRLAQLEESGREPIAIVAMACRFPGGVGSPEDLWELVHSGTDAIGPFPADRGWDRHGFAGRAAGGFLYDAAEFDAALFGISPREATAMDPQQRLLLETAWQVFERARIDPHAMRGTDTGLFAGLMYHDYAARLPAVPDDLEGFLINGTAGSVATGRLAYTFGLQGPAVTVDTACSSSLVAIHLAANALRNGECSLALAGGVTVMGTPAMFRDFDRQGGLAADGRCKAFADGADGTGFAEGVGLLLLEKLSDARRNGHPVVAVLRGSAVSQDGATNGLTAPSGPAQQRVIRAALHNAGLVTADVDAVEAHGTGTSLGDPIEAGALLATYGRNREPATPLWLGSLKSNIGHAQAAAGVGGVIKMVMALRHGILPRTLHVDRGTSHVDWSAGTVRLLTEEQPWPATDHPRRAGISSFGASGTNAHLIVEQAPDEEPAPVGSDVRSLAPVVVSGGTPDALRRQARRLRDHLTDRPSYAVGDVARSTLLTRAALPHRGAVLAADRADLLDALDLLAEGRTAAAVVTGVAAGGGTGLLFTGQGAQHPGMGRALYQAVPAFAAEFDAVCAELDRHLDRPLKDVLWADPADGLIDRTEYTQPGLFAIEAALFRTLAGWGVTPAAVAGHSIGEVAAAYAAGIFSLADAAVLVTARGRLMQALPAGGVMIAVEATEDEVLALIAGRERELAVAAVNGPRAVVLSGDGPAAEEVAAELAGRGRRTRRLAVSHAFHSPHMDPMLDEFGSVLADLTFQEPQMPVISNRTGAVAGAEIRTPEYWTRHVREAVRFGDCLDRLAADGITTLVELGPDGVLSALAAASLDPERAVAIPTLRKDQDEEYALRAALAHLHVRGVPVNWSDVASGSMVDLPTYAFERERFWLTPAGDPAGGAATLTYRSEWRGVTEPSAPALSGRWLLVTGTGEDPLADAVAAALTRAGAQVDIRDAATLGTISQPLAGVVSLATLSDRPHPDHPDIGHDLVATTTLIQKLSATGLAVPLWIVTRRAVQVATEAPAPDAASVWGFTRSAFVEMPQLRGGLIDLPAEAGARDAHRVVALLGAAEEGEYALRAAGTFTRRLVTVRGSVEAPTFAWPGRTVLITGGTGALGAVVARRLAAAGTGNLVLVSRRGLAAPGTDALVADLQKLGTEVSVVAGDIAEPDTAAAVLAQVPADRPLAAVFHTAGVLDDGVVEGFDPTRLATVARAKLTGARHLDELTRELPLDAFVLFSSMSGTTGAAGQANYAAANAALDAVAEARHAAGLPATSVAWGAWSGDGMADRPEVERRLSHTGIRPMPPEAALDALSSALGDGLPTVVIADVDWPRFAATGTGSLLGDLVPAVVVSAPTPVPVVPATDFTRLTEAERDATLLRLVAEHAAAVLGHRDERAIRADQPFTALGFTSLAAVEFRNRLGAAIGRPVAATAVFDHPTPAALAEHLGDLVRPAAPENDESPLRYVERLEAAFAADLEESTRAELADRLRALVNGLPIPRQRTTDDPPESADDIFAYIDDKYGAR